jgi:hypothetical protein
MNRRMSRVHRSSWAILAAVLAFSAAPSSAKTHDSTLTGNGTPASPLGVNIPLSLNYRCNTPICYQRLRSM